MNRSRRSLYLPLVGLLALSCGVGERRHETIVREWPAGEIREVKVGSVNGSVDVTAWPQQRILLTAHVRTRRDPQPNAENKGYFETRIAGETLRIGTPESKKIGFRFGRKDLNVDYILRMPPTVALDLKTVNGRIATRGVDAETEATSVNGSIEVETAGTAEVRLVTVNGPVRAKFSRAFAGARMKTVNGSVEATLPASASFSCDLSQVNGDFKASFPLSIHSHPGSRRVSGEVQGGRHPLRIVTVNGDIRIETGDVPPPVPARPSVPDVRPSHPTPPAAPPPPPS